MAGIDGSNLGIKLLPIHGAVNGLLLNVVVLKYRQCCHAVGDLVIAGSERLQAEEIMDGGQQFLQGNIRYPRHFRKADIFSKRKHTGAEQRQLRLLLAKTTEEVRE